MKLFSTLKRGPWGPRYTFHHDLFIVYLLGFGLMIAFIEKIPLWAFILWSVSTIALAVHSAFSLKRTLIQLFRILRGKYG